MGDSALGAVGQRELSCTVSRVRRSLVMKKGDGKADADRFAVFPDGHEWPVTPLSGGSSGNADSRLSQSVGTGM